MTADIYIQIGPAGGVASSSAAFDSVTYASYLAALKGESNSSAVNSLPSVEPAVYGGDNIAITSALAQALGAAGPLAGVESDGMTPCVLGSPNCYNGVVTVDAGIYYVPPATGSNYDFFSLVEHETDEVLGTISCLSTLGTGIGQIGCTSTSGNTTSYYASAADLFRYTAPGVPTWVNTADGSAPAYFSIDGGMTVVNTYNNLPNGYDYGDWAGGCFVQAVEGCLGTNVDITNDGGSEITVLNAIGFDIAPEPGTAAIVGLGIVALGAFAARRSALSR
jgi:hypothetical protein